METGVYTTIHGNTATYHEGDLTAYDVDMGENIPLDMLEVKMDLNIEDFE